MLSLIHTNPLPPHAEADVHPKPSALSPQARLSAPIARKSAHSARGEEAQYQQANLPEAGPYIQLLQASPAIIVDANISIEFLSAALDLCHRSGFVDPRARLLWTGSVVGLFALVLSLFYFGARLELLCNYNEVFEVDIGKKIHAANVAQPFEGYVIAVSTSRFKIICKNVETFNGCSVTEPEGSNKLSCKKLSDS